MTDISSTSVRLQALHRSIIRALAVTIAIALASSFALAADPTPDVVLNVAKAGPRTVEPLTERSILRDYRFAWVNLANALASNSTSPTNGLLEGSADAWLKDRVASQRRSGLTSKYSNQTHKLEAVFYAPEGDMMELHDTAEYDLQIFDGNKTIHTGHAVVHYIVLMTPGADRWVVRQLQAVPQF